MTGTATTEKISDVPNQPKTPARAVRIDDARWERVKREAERRGETASDVVRRAIDEHLRALDPGKK